MNSQKIRRFGLLVVALAALSAGVFLAADEELYADDPVLEGDDVVTHDWGDRFPIENSTKFIQQGVAVDGGCKYTLRLDATAESPRKIARILATKNSTCERLVKSGDLSDTGKGVIDEEESRATGQDKAASRNSGGEGAAATSYQDEWWGDTVLGAGPVPWSNQPRWIEQSLPQTRASYKTRWEDPVDLDVNWVKSKVRFRYDSAAAQVYYQSGSVENHWLIASGWLHDSEDLTASWYYKDDSERVVVEGDDEFRNHVFCNATLGVPITDRVYYRDNRVVGTWAGTAWGESDSWVTGFCANLLLHEEHVLQFN